MALTPQNQDTFFREVDEELRREQLGSFWRRYGRLVAIGIVAALLALAGFLWWQHSRETKAGAAGETLADALHDVSTGQTKAAEPKLAQLSESALPGYAAGAKLTQAALALDAGDQKVALARYRSVIDDAGLPQPFRDLALLRATTIEFDALPPATVVERLKPLAAEGNPWFGSAGELVALAYIKMNKRELAGPLLVAMTRDTAVPETIRSRAVRLAGSIGFDAVAPQGPAQGSTGG